MVIKDVVARMPVADYLAVRFVVAAVALVVLRPRSLGALTGGERRRGVVLGVLYGVAQLLQTAGLQHTAASVSGFVTGMYVVLTPLFAAPLLRQRVGVTAWSAVGLATAGLALLSLRGASVGPGEALTLLAAGFYALHIVGLGAWSTPRSAYGLSVVQMLTICVVCGLGALPGGITLPPDGGAWVAVLYTGLLAAAVALLVQTWAQAHLAPTRAAIIMTMEPVFAAFFAVLLGGEHLGLRTLAGAALVLTAMYVTELGPRRGADAAVDHLVV